MINVNSDLGSLVPKTNLDAVKIGKSGPPGVGKIDFAKAVKAAGDYMSKVDDQQESANTSIKDLLSGKNEDITTIVANVAKADMSFKVLVGVRNKLIEAYKQTMTMQI
ncbi:MAG: flagellar hook-basal body complex protein FliE [Planctomycetota bacterium]|jgi:flagellar hook-basal body complex protein FliE